MENLELIFQKSKDLLDSIKQEVQKDVVGHNEVLEELLAGLLCNGHILLEGVPGLGKTLLVKTLSTVLGVTTRRIQFTPDLMPADIMGTQVLYQSDHDTKIRFEAGPVFTNILLADEINRATPKTQSALLEAMQEKQVTVSGTSHLLEDPFLVLATQNPLEMEGTYPLPEAQMDRFLFKSVLNFPAHDELKRIIVLTTGTETNQPSSVLSGKDIVELQQLVPQIVASDAVITYALELVKKTHDGENIRYGCSPRGAKSLVLAAKAFALMDGRPQAGFEDIRRAALPVLRHRIILSFEGEAEGLTQDDIINDIVRLTATPGS